MPKLISFSDILVNDDFKCFRYHYPRFPRVFFVSLKVGQREFIGDGKTRQAARHNAAAKALNVRYCLCIVPLFPG